MKNKIKIYLCDFVHNYLGVGTYMFPLNIGFIAAWTNKFFSEDVDIQLFKYPGDFIKQFQELNADLVGFSNYTWNADLNNKISRWVKSISPMLTEEASGSGQYDSDYPKFAVKARELRKAVMGTESISALLTEEQKSRVEEGVKTILKKIPQEEEKGGD